MSWSNWGLLFSRHARLAKRRHANYDLNLVFFSPVLDSASRSREYSGQAFFAGLRSKLRQFCGIDGQSY
jgi:hypothetical protein